MELTRKEFMMQDNSPVLKEFLKSNSELLDKLVADSKTAQVRSVFQADSLCQGNPATNTCPDTGYPWADPGA